MYIDALRGFAESGTSSQREEALRILRHLKHKNRNLLFFRERPNILLFLLDDLEEKISKGKHGSYEGMRESYKGRPKEEKENDARALYEKIYPRYEEYLGSDGWLYKKEVKGDPYPKKKNPKTKELVEREIDLRTKRTIAISFFCTHHKLQFAEIRDLDRYWNGLRKKDPVKYHQMLAKASKRSVTIYLD